MSADGWIEWKGESMSRFAADEITKEWGPKCSEFISDCPACQIWALHDESEALEDRLEGLTADLDSAVEVAFKRGATEWVRLNYPDHFKRLSAAA